MISKLTVERLKQFGAPKEFELRPDGVSLLAGGNNSGKSTLMQALAIWGFIRTTIEHTEGRAELSPAQLHERVRVTFEDFHPILVPDLKHLWNGLRPNAGPIKIRVEWRHKEEPRHLELAMDLVRGRLGVECFSSNVPTDEPIPRVAYLPTFAGIDRKEHRLPLHERRKLVGKGLAGAVLRNWVLDLQEKSELDRAAAYKLPGRFKRIALREWQSSDPYQRLEAALAEVFETGLSVAYSEAADAEISVQAWKGTPQAGTFRKVQGTSSTDVMVEGSGFLQWLSVFSLCVSPDNDVVLLDEPDAHLHPTLQNELIQKLREVASDNGKQVLMATHSTTILENQALDRIFRIETAKYLEYDKDRVNLLAGLGCAFAPNIHRIKQDKRVMFYEGPSDIAILQIWAATLRIVWPERLHLWQETKMKLETREALVKQLRSEIPGLKAISIHDRDELPYNESHENLSYRSLPNERDGLRCRLWRRREIENYLVTPALARVAHISQMQVDQEFGIMMPPNYRDSDCPVILRDVDIKYLLYESETSFCTKYGLTYRDVAREMRADEIPEDPITLLHQIIELCQT